MNNPPSPALLLPLISFCRQAHVADKTHSASGRRKKSLSGLCPEPRRCGLAIPQASPARPSLAPAGAFSYMRYLCNTPLAAMPSEGYKTPPLQAGDYIHCKPVAARGHMNGRGPRSGRDGAKRRVYRHHTRSRRGRWHKKKPPVRVALIVLVKGFTGVCRRSSRSGTRNCRRSSPDGSS